MQKEDETQFEHRKKTTFSSFLNLIFEKNRKDGITKFGRRIKKSLEQKQNYIQVFILIF
jgi:hypothetical protein